LLRVQRAQRTGGNFSPKGEKFTYQKVIYMAKVSILSILVVAIVAAGSTGNAHEISPGRSAASTESWAPAAEGLGVEGAGLISAITGGCPTPTIVVRGVPIAITATTVFEDSLACGSLAVNQRVRVKALLTHDGAGYTVEATYVAQVDDSGGAGRKASGEGVVGAITGTCPTLGLVITGTKVSTTATTEYVNGTCASLRPGTQVKIDGELRPGGTAIAENIELRRIPGRPVAGDGPVGSVTGTCPSLTMMVRGIAVVTDGTTAFSGGTCSSIGPGTHVDVTGEYDGTTVTATAVALRGQGRR